MKLIIQVPCFNESESLPVALAALPKQLDGIDRIEVLVVDDGSTDGTADLARQLGVDHIVSLPQNAGLARAFMAGIEASLREGADIIVNTDADNQYYAGDISRLIAPILQGKAEMVVGARPVKDNPHFSPAKKLLQRLGSWVVRAASHTTVPDAPSGFRAFSRSAAAQLHVFSSYTYTLETIIAAGRKGIAVTSVPVRVNPELRPSRLISSIPRYIKRSILTIVRILIVYRPFAFFMVLGVSAFLPGFLLGLRFVYYYLFTPDSTGKIQSLMLATLLMTFGFLFVAMGVLADLMSVNRRLSENLSARLWQIENVLRPQRQTKQDRRSAVKK